MRHFNSEREHRTIKMLLACTVILIYGFDTVHSQLSLTMEEIKIKPERCYGTDDLLDRRCCIFPPFFNRASARECGAISALVFMDNHFNVTGARRDMPGQCSYWECILKKYQLLDDDDYLILDKYFMHLDNWAVLNNEFSVTLTAAKVLCRDVSRYRLPIKVCQFFDFQGCIRNYVNVDCPKIIQTEECFQWKEFFEECKEFFV